MANTANTASSPLPLSDLELQDSWIMLQGIDREGSFFPDTTSATTERATDIEIDLGQLVHCGTQAASSGIFSLNIGLGNEIPCWKKGSEITFNGKPGSFPEGDYDKTIEALNKAAKEWNDLNLGVSFNRVADNEPAVFQLIYKEDIHCGNETFLARAFFPNASPEDRELVVYALSLTDHYKEYLPNIFLHELGHVLGLRHEFADTQESDKSVRFGERNDLSVMNYHDHPSQFLLYEHDKENTCKFYALTEEFYKSVPIVRVSANVDVDSCEQLDGYLWVGKDV